MACQGLLLSRRIPRVQHLEASPQLTLEVLLLSTTRLLRVSHPENQYGNKQENLRGKCIELLIQLGIVTATAIQAHMSHPHIVRQWLDLLQTHLALHRQLLPRRLQIKDSQQSARLQQLMEQAHI